MTITVTDFRKIEEGIMLLLESEYGDKNNDKVEDFLNGLRLYLKDRVKIQGMSPVDEVPFEYPVALSEPPIKPRNNMLPKGSLK